MIGQRKSNGRIQWYFQIELPGSSRAQRKRLRKSGFTSEKEAEIAEAAARKTEYARSSDTVVERTPPPSGTPEYAAWDGMFYRCYRLVPTDREYRLYCGKGITVCERWQKFDNFLADMGLRPSPKHTLDRINPDGNYEPENCRWATWEQQNRNKKTGLRPIEFNGECLLLTDWAKRLGIHPNSLRHRLKSGWSLEKALTVPVATVRPRGATTAIRRPPWPPKRLPRRRSGTLSD